MSNFNPFKRFLLVGRSRRVGDDPTTYTGPINKLHTKKAIMITKNSSASRATAFGSSSGKDGMSIDQGGGLWDTPYVYAVFTFSGSFCTYVEARLDEEALAIVMLGADFIYVPHRGRDYLEKQGASSVTTFPPAALKDLIIESVDIKLWCDENFDSVQHLESNQHSLKSANTSADVITHLPLCGVWFKTDNAAVLFKLRWGR